MGHDIYLLADVHNTTCKVALPTKIEPVLVKTSGFYYKSIGKTELEKHGKCVLGI